MVCENGHLQQRKELDSRVRPLVSVIIPVYNDAGDLRQCLLALEQQTFPADDFEVLVIDNGSNPPLSDPAQEFPGVYFLVEPRPGSYAARNTGIAHARGDILAFLDSDCRPAPYWLARGTAKLDEGDVVGGRMILTHRDPEDPMAVELYDGLTSFRQQEYVEKSRFSITANLFARRKVFDAIGLFDLNLKSGGDCEWGNRAHAAGCRLVYAEDATVYHPARASFKDVSRKQRRVGGGLGQKLREAQHIHWGKVTRTELIEVLIFLRLCYEILRYEKIPASKKLRMFLINIGISSLRIYELNKVLLGGKPLR